MNHADALTRLEEYFDGTLSPEAHREIEAHLAGCPHCRDELSSLGALLDTVTEMREKQTEPPRDLWPEIAARVALGSRSDTDREAAASRRTSRDLGTDDPVPGRLRTSPGGNRISWPWLAGAVGLAAAAVLVLFILPGSRRGAGKVDVAGHNPPASTAAAPAADGSETMTRELAMLDAQVKSSRQSVRQEGLAGAADTTVAAPAWRIFDQSLGVLDQAIRDSRAALEREPNSPVLQKSLLAAYQKQLELIRWANRVIRQG